MLVSALGLAFISFGAARDAFFTARAASLLAAPVVDPSTIALPEAGNARLFYALGARALRGPEPNHALARAALLRAAALDGDSAEIWCRLALAEFALAERAPGSADDALLRCFDVDPIGYSSIGTWRLRFILTIWGSVGEDVRARARTQMAHLRQLPDGRLTLYALSRETFADAPRSELERALPHNQP